MIANIIKEIEKNTDESSIPPQQPSFNQFVYG
jgi:hypothetical protein